MNREVSQVTGFEIWRMSNFGRMDIKLQRVNYWEGGFTIKSEVSALVDSKRESFIIIGDAASVKEENNFLFRSF